MTEAQILAASLPAVATMITILIAIANNNARLNDLRSQIDVQFDEAGAWTK